jgi:hypothetical protein
MGVSFVRPLATARETQATCARRHAPDEFLQACILVAAAARDLRTILAKRVPVDDFALAELTPRPFE